MEAASRGYLEIVEILLCHYTSVNACDDENMNALTNASINGHYTIVERLLERKADVHIRNHENETALMIACRKGHLNVVSVLIKHIYDCLNNCYINKEEVFSTPENENKLAFSKLPYAFCSPPITEVSEEINQAFLNTYLYGHLDIMKFLLDNGVSVQVKLRSSLTLLNHAVYRGKYEIVNLLLENGAQVQKRANSSIPPLMLATCRGHIDIVKLLLTHGANINSTSEHMPLAVTWLEGIWIQQHSNESERKSTDKNGTALICAIQTGSSFELIETLLQVKNVNINSKTYMGRSALMVACGSSQEKVVELLLHYKADVNIRSNQGATALDIATVRDLESNNEKIIKALLRNGAIHSQDMIPFPEGYQLHDMQSTDSNYGVGRLCDLLQIIMIILMQFLITKCE